MTGISFRGVLFPAENVEPSFEPRYMPEALRRHRRAHQIMKRANAEQVHRRGRRRVSAEAVEPGPPCGSALDFSGARPPLDEEVQDGAGGAPGQAWMFSGQLLQPASAPGDASNFSSLPAVHDDPTLVD